MNVILDGEQAGADVSAAENSFDTMYKIKRCYTSLYARPLDEMLDGTVTAEIGTFETQRPYNREYIAGNVSARLVASARCSSHFVQVTEAQSEHKVLT